MKTFYFFFSAVILSAILFSSCKKNKDATQTTLEKLQYKWSFTKEFYHDLFLGVESRDTTTGLSTDYVDFRSDNKVYSRQGTNYDTSSYALMDDSHLITSSGGTNDTLTIQVLNDHALQVYSRSGTATNYYEFTDIFAK